MTVSAKGNISLSIGQQLLKMNRLQYDFNNKKGYLFDVKGLIKTDNIIERFDKIRNSKGNSTTGELRTSMQHIMQQKCAVFRTHDLISKGIEEYSKVESSMDDIDIKDKSLIFNTDLVEALELHNLMAQSKVTLHSALNRTESRGAHAREDYKERDDNNWLVHSLAWLNDKGDVSMGSRGVHMNTLTNHVQPIPPKRRVY